MKTPTLALCAIAACSSTTLAQVANPNPGWDSEWPALEGSFLSDYVQLTHSSKYIKAGESYFSPDGKMIIFQAIPLPEEGEKAGAHYSMYVAGVERDDSGAITGLGPAGLVSKPGSSNTCGWFHPTQPMKILFGSTRTAPDGSDVVGYQRENSRYSWQFPVEMEILAGDLTMKYDLSDEAKARAKAYQESGETKPPMVDMNDIVSVPSLSGAQPIWQREGYDAEGSWSPDGRHILYTRLQPGENNGDIWVYDTTDESHTPLVTADGYDGGPFFSPDGKSICYRSDRRGDNLLQIFVSVLEFDENGKIIGVEEELQLTENEHVNWCPFYTPDGKYLLYATSEVSHGNYEIFAIDATGTYEPEYTARLRITQARGFDGLPAFTSNGEWMIWTAQRGDAPEGEKPSSQLWTARIDLEAIDAAYRAEQEKLTPND
ncbi:MAG: TolB family protein [Phycisphaerales bacterium]